MGQGRHQAGAGIPGFLDHKASGFIVVDNFTNLLNDEWGILREPDFPSVCAVDDFRRVTVNLAKAMHRATKSASACVTSSSLLNFVI